jgi:hypothetical protein
VFWRNGGDGESYVCASVFKLLKRIALNAATIFSIAQTVHERHGAVEKTGGLRGNGAVARDQLMGLQALLAHGQQLPVDSTNL